jgi:hypothetical protein
MQEDIRNAGGEPQVKNVVRDRNLLTCAREEDMPLLIRELVASLCSGK